MPEFDLFSSEELPAEEIKQIFESEALEIQTDVIPPSEEYFAERRKLMGPVADITHPEFGRPNRPEETFMMSYRILEEPCIETTTDETGNKVYTQRISYTVAEYVVDCALNLVEIQAPN